MSISCSDCSVINCFFKHCNDETKIQVEQSKKITTYKKGQFIFNEGGPVDGIFIINSGKVKVFNTGYNSRVQVIRLAKAGHILGHRGIGDKTYSISAIALEDSALGFIDNTAFNAILKNNSELSFKLMLFYADELRMAEARMKSLAQMTVKEKVVESIFLLKKAFGVHIGKEIVLDIPFGRKDLGELTGLRAEQVTRVLSELKEEGFISSGVKNLTILKPRELFEFINQYYVSEMFNENKLPVLQE